MKIKITLLLLSIGIFVKSQIGEFDPSFIIGSGSNDYVYDIAIQPDQKIIAAGRFTQFNDNNRKYLVRLNTDGSTDYSFYPFVTNTDSMSRIAIDNSGKLIVGGRNQNATGYLVRLNTNGSIDNTFFQHTSLYSNPSDITILTNGQILVGSSSSKGILRLNNNGTIDNTFNTGNVGANGYVTKAKLLSNGKIIICGYFTQYNGVIRNGTARLNSDGTLDETFDPGLGFKNNDSKGTAYTIEEQSDGKLLFGGLFTSFNGTSRNYIARLNADGSLDSSFNPQMGFNNALLFINANYHNKIFVSGGFMQFNGVTKNYVAILNNDGSLADVNTDSSFDNFVHRCLSQNDGKLVCGGLFSQYQSNPSKGVVRIIPNDLLSINETNSTKIKIAPNPTSDIISVFIEDNTQANLYDANGKLIQTFFLQPKQNTISLANYPHGVYIIELISKTQKQRFKLIKK